MHAYLAYRLRELVVVLRPVYVIGVFNSEATKHLVWLARDVQTLSVNGATRMPFRDRRQRFRCRWLGINDDTVDIEETSNDCVCHVTISSVPFLRLRLLPAPSVEEPDAIGDRSS
jgi:hypothetical protein